jgi:hypothetical protein
VEERHANRRTRHGEEALDAALDERDIRERTDEPDASQAQPGDYDLSEVVDDRLRVAAGTDVYTPDEALDDIASGLGRELPTDASDDEERPA